MDIIFSGKIISIIFSSLLLLFFLYFVLYAAVRCSGRDKGKSSVHRLTVMVSLSAILLVLSDIACSESVTEMLVFEIAIAMFPMVVGMKTDITWDETIPYGFAVLVFSIAVVLLRVMVPSVMEAFSILPSVASCLMTVVLAVVVYRDFFKMVSDKGNILRATSVKTRVNGELDTLYVFGMMSIFVVQLSSDGKCSVCRRAVFLVCFVSILLLFFSCHRRITSGCLSVFSRKRNEKMKEMMDLCVNEVKGRENAKIDYNYREIYERGAGVFRERETLSESGTQCG